MIRKWRIAIMAGAIFLVFVALGCTFECCKKTKSMVDQEPIMTRIYCNPVFISKELSTLSNIFDAIPAGGKGKVILYGPFPSEGQSAFILNTKLTIFQGAVSVKCTNGEVTYKPNGELVLDWKEKQLIAHEKSKITSISISLLKNRGCISFGWLVSLNDDDIPIANQEPILLLPLQNGDDGAEFILEFDKSLDYKSKPSNFYIERSL